MLKRLQIKISQPGPILLVIPRRRTPHPTRQSRDITRITAGHPRTHRCAHGAVQSVYYVQIRTHHPTQNMLTIWYSQYSLEHTIARTHAACNTMHAATHSVSVYIMLDGRTKGSANAANVFYNNNNNNLYYNSPYGFCLWRLFVVVTDRVLGRSLYDMS